jgi:phenylpropionate dioxygenase-like ring-hydroxylating dioxygenase large terminal subunit
MADTRDIKERIKDRVNQGLLGQWYAVAKSVDVQPGRPHAVKALGQSLVLWREPDGKVSCVEDYCPHRGAPLSRGIVHDIGIACRYHGVVVDRAGTIARVPAMPDCPLEGRKAVASYQTTEAADAIFAFFPSVERPVAPPINLPPELSDPEWTGFLCTSPWACNYRYALDNLADPMHGCYLHAESFTLAYGAKQDLMKLDKTEHGFIVRRVQQAGENFDWTEMVFGASTWCRLDLPYPKAAGPGGIFRIIGYCTPIDETSCKVYFWRLRKIVGLEREAWRFMYRALLEERHWNVLEQDRVMLSAMPDDARMREMLYQHDIGVGALRQTLTRCARSQVEAEDAAAARSAAAS